MINLLKRDLKLYWGDMVLASFVILLIMGLSAMFGKDKALAYAIAGSWLIVFLSPSIHLREIKQGTLPDLMALPCSRTALVSLRYIEVLLFSAVTIFIAHLLVWLAQGMAAHGFVLSDIMDRTVFASPAVYILLFFAFPMPFMFRWDGKGFIVVLVIVYVLVNGIAQLIRWFSLGHGEYREAFTRFIMYLKDHPNQATFGFLLLFLTLFTISYLLSLKAFSSRDF